MDPVRQQLQAEAARRFGGQMPSSAGIGAPVANNPSTSANPMAAHGLVTPPAPNPMAARANMPTAPSQPPMPSAQNPEAGAIGAMQGAAPSGGRHIERALINRMNQYPPTP